MKDRTEYMRAYWAANKEKLKAKRKEPKLRPTEEEKYRIARDNANRKRKVGGQPKYTWNGQRKSVPEWCAEIGIARATFHRRMADGWPMERIVTTPSRKTGVKCTDTERTCVECNETFPIEEFQRGQFKKLSKKCTSCQYQLRKMGVQRRSRGIPGEFDPLLFRSKWPGTIEGDVSRYPRDDIEGGECFRSCNG